MRIGPGPNQQAFLVRDASEIVGRDDVRRRLAEVVAGVDRRRGASLIVVGEAGMGKSILLHEVGRVASEKGFAVAAVSGRDCEISLPYSVAADLLLPFQRLEGALPAAYRSALETVVAPGTGPRSGELTVYAAALTLLSQAAAADRPLVIVVDDFQWVDLESARLLAFVARRIAGERIAIVFASRSEPGTRATTWDLPAVELAPLSRSECLELAARLGVSASSADLSRLVEMTGGNPLALVEVARARVNGYIDRGDAEWSGFQPGAFNPSLERTWGRIWDELPMDCRLALFLVAASQGVQGAHPLLALDRLGLSLSALTPAEDRGLVFVRDAEVELRHPLLGSLAQARTPLAVRTRCFGAIAEVADSTIAPWFGAAGAVGPNAKLADTLETMAEQIGRMSGLMTPARMLYRSAELTSDRRLRAQRMLGAAENAYLAGDALLAARWSNEAAELYQDPAFVVEAARVHCRALVWSGNPGVACDVVAIACESARGLSPALLAAAWAESCFAAAMLSDVHRSVRIAERVGELWRHSPDAERDATPLIHALLAEAWSMGGYLDRARRQVRTATASLDSAAAHDLHAPAVVAQTLARSEQLDEARARLTPALRAARQLASPPLLGWMLSISGEISWWTGDWQVGYADASEALQWATEFGSPAIQGYALSMLARLTAGRADSAACRALVTRGERIKAQGVRCIGIYSEAELGLALLGSGDLRGAIRHLHSSWELSRDSGNGNPNVVPLAGDLAEALARAGERSACLEVIEWLEERAAATGLSHPRAAGLRARGILERVPGTAEQLFGESVEIHRRMGPIPFEEARTLLCLGESMRRTRRPTDARRPLAEADALFQQLGALPWAERARAELAATGWHPPCPEPRKVSALDALTPQEFQIARAVGRGMTNPEVAVHLFVSRKTVEAHLTRVYRRLGIRSRTELARVLVELGVRD